MIRKTLFDSLNRAIVATYMEDCMVRGLAPKTLRWYEWHLTRYADWVAGRYLLIDESTLNSYFASTVRDLAHSSRRNLRACLRAWGTWVAGHGVPNPAASLPRLRRARTRPKVLSPRELDRLLRLLPHLPEREAAIIAFILDTGLRVSELVALNRDDLDLEYSQVTVRHGKGDKSRVAFFSDTTGRFLSRYLSTHGWPHVWHGTNATGDSGPLTENGVRQALRRVAHDHGFESLSPHLLRRTCGSALLGRGVGLSVISDQLGHEDLQVTRDYYARLADPVRRDKVRQHSVVESVLQPVLVPDWPRSSPGQE